MRVLHFAGDESMKPWYARSAVFLFKYRFFFKKMVSTSCKPAVVWAVLAAAVGNARGETFRKTFPDCSWKGSTSVSYDTDFTCYDVPSTGYATFTIREVRARRMIARASSPN